MLSAAAYAVNYSQKHFGLTCRLDSVIVTDNAKDACRFGRSVDSGSREVG